jgi:Tol biopolymer transport system component
MTKKLLSLAVASCLIAPGVWAAGQTTRVSVLPDGSEPMYPGKFDGHSSASSISKDGNLVVFTSNSADLVPGDTNGTNDVFVKNQKTGEITRVSVASDGAQGDNESSDGQISADGRFVLFRSTASNLVPGDSGDNADIFVHELATKKTTLVTVDTDGKPAVRKEIDWEKTRAEWDKTDNANCDQYDRYACEYIYKDKPIYKAYNWPAGISGDGRFVLFGSDATNLSGADLSNPYGNTVAYIRDMTSGTVTMVTAPRYYYDSDKKEYKQYTYQDKDGKEVVRFEPLYTGGHQAVLSENGSVVAFSSGDNSLVPNDKNDGYSWGDNNGTRNCGGSFTDDEGYYHDHQSCSDVFVWNKDTKTVTLVSAAADGKSAYSKVEIDPATEAVDDKYSRGAYSQAPSISADGQKVAFVSDAVNLVAGQEDKNEAVDVFVRDIAAGKTERASVLSGGGEAPSTDCEYHYNSNKGDYTRDDCAGSWGPVISADGQVVAFTSNASTLVPNDINGMADVFAHELAGKQTSMVSVSTEGKQGDESSGDPVISGDGRFVAFNSHSSTLVKDDNNESQDVFVRDRSPEADVTSALTASANPVRKKAPMSVTLTVTNRGGLPATGVTANLYAAKGLKLKKPDACKKAKSDVKGSVLYVCSLGDIPVGQSVTVTGAAKPRKKGGLPVQAKAPKAGNEVNDANNNSDLTVTVQ